VFFFSSRRRHTRWPRDWSSDVCSSDLISLQQALIQSCDTVFYNFGQTFWQRFRAGQGEQLQAFARDFGLGSTTGLEIPGEQAGQIGRASCRERAESSVGAVAGKRT